MRNDGRWTEARFNSFIKSLLRKGTMKWPPKTETLKNSRVAKGVYRCDGCKQDVPVTVKIDGKRVRNVFVDHIAPIVPPDLGFTTWGDYINNMFCDSSNLQTLCSACHTTKTMEERAIAKERKRNGSG
jgi:hypothetical protein